MKPTYWVISRELLKRCLNTSNYFQTKTLEIVSSDYENNRQHIRAIVKTYGLKMDMPEYRVKIALNQNFCSDVAVMNVSYQGYGEYIVNMDVKMKIDTSENASMRDTDLSWLG